MFFEKSWIWKNGGTILAPGGGTADAVEASFWRSYVCNAWAKFPFFFDKVNSWTKKGNLKIQDENILCKVKNDNFKGNFIFELEKIDLKLEEKRIKQRFSQIGKEEKF